MAINSVPSIKLNNGRSIPQIGFGTAYISFDEDKAVEIVKEAFKAGYRHIDTAEDYDSEIAIGRAIKESGIPREELFITTKLGVQDQRKKRFEEALEESLEKLQLDYLDMYLLHWPVPGFYVKAWKALEKMLESGKVKTIGVCNFTIRHLKDIKRISDVIPAVNQCEFNPRFAQPELREYCAKEGIACEAFAPLGTGYYAAHREPFEAIGKKYGKTFAQVILRWEIQKGLIVIPKASHTEYLKSNFDVLDFSLDEDDMAMIDAMDIGRASFELGTPDCFDWAYEPL